MGYAPDITLGFFTIVAFVVSLVVCYAVGVVKNWKRDVYHQIPLLKAFLYALGWTPVILICILLMLNVMG
jgi:hypothetical protein